MALTLLALLVLAWLAVSVWSRSGVFLDEPIRSAVHSLGSPALTAVMRVLTILGARTFLIPAGIVAAALLPAQRLRSRGARAALWTVAVALAGLVGLSRVYLGVHYPSDVLGGYALAVVWVAAVRALLPMRP